MDLTLKKTVREAICVGAALALAAGLATGAAAQGGPEPLPHASWQAAIGGGEPGAATPELSFIYRYAGEISEKAALAVRRRAEEEEAKRLAEAERRMEEAKNSVAALTEAQLDELFSEEYFVERMKALGFYKDEFSDSGLNLRNAVIRLQSSVNHPVDAILGVISKKALLEDSPVTATDEVASPASDSFWITINKSRNILTVYKGAAVHKKYPVATGASASLTPEGKFTIVSKAVNPSWGGGGYASPIAGGLPSNPLGKRWMGLSIGGGGRYGVHGNASPRSIGTYASHGCVRMINPDVEELYDYIPTSTPVWIGTDAKLKEFGVLQYHNDPAADALAAAQAYTGPSEGDAGAPGILAADGVVDAGSAGAGAAAAPAGELTESAAKGGRASLFQKPAADAGAATPPEL
ncbi:MAG: L,D-transpeptidase [Clostridiales bacterium]|nr:L,D-transpeptidase [Clostridiales bacterium]